MDKEKYTQLKTFLRRFNSHPAFMKKQYIQKQKTH